MTRKPILTALTLALISGAAHAGTIERACLQLRAQGRQPRDLRLHPARRQRDARQQRPASGRELLQRPPAHQEIRQSDRRNHARFWAKYSRFGTTAETRCRAS